MNNPTPPTAPKIRFIDHRKMILKNRAMNMNGREKQAQAWRDLLAATGTDDRLEQVLIITSAILSQNPDPKEAKIKQMVRAGRLADLEDLTGRLTDLAGLH